MSFEKATFTLARHNPDVLTCIANLSNDEVFTPPEFANRMLDTLEMAWAESHDGGSIWADSSVTFLDPFTKSGVFLREITARLTSGLTEQIPGLEERVDHILTKQVFGIGTTTLTSLLARRSVYCSKNAAGPHSIAKSFGRDWGNIWFERTEHTWVGGRDSDQLGPNGEPLIIGRTCRYCPAAEKDYARGVDLETHAYAFIHTDDIDARIAELFGAEMQFDVIVGNPPYQLGSSGGDSVGSFAMPIYQDFIQMAKKLDPRYLMMVTPSRWFAGGRGLAEFRADMLSDRRLRVLCDFPDSRDVFDGVDIAGGVSYFLWDASWDGDCEVMTTIVGRANSAMSRDLREYDIFVRYNEATTILHRVLGTAGESVLSRQVAPIQPFSLRTNFRGATSPEGLREPVRLYQNGGVGYIERADVPRNREWIDQWKVFLSGSASEHGGQADSTGTRRVFSRIILGEPGTACTETYLVVNRFESEQAASNFAAYLRTKFVRFLVSLRTNTQHLYSERFAFVPDLPMDREWSDTELYDQYGLNSDERDFIEAMIKPMPQVADADA